MSYDTLRYVKPAAWLLSLSVLAIPAFGPQSPREPLAADRARLADEYLKKKLAFWQERMKLQDWDVSIVASRSSQLRPGTKGNIRWDAGRHKAVIRVLEAASYEMPYQPMIEDMEFTVVHELVHLQLSSLPRSEASRRDEEHAVNRIAEALLNLERGR